MAEDTKPDTETAKVSATKKKTVAKKTAKKKASAKKTTSSKVTTKKAPVKRASAVTPAQAPAAQAPTTTQAPTKQAPTKQAPTKQAIPQAAPQPPPPPPPGPSTGEGDYSYDADADNPGMSGMLVTAGPLIILGFLVLVMSNEQRVPSTAAASAVAIEPAVSQSHPLTPDAVKDAAANDASKALAEAFKEAGIKLPVAPQDTVAVTIPDDLKLPADMQKNPWAPALSGAGNADENAPPPPPPANPQAAGPGYPQGSPGRGWGYPGQMRGYNPYFGGYAWQPPPGYMMPMNPYWGPMPGYGYGNGMGGMPTRGYPQGSYPRHPVPPPQAAMPGDPAAIPGQDAVQKPLAQ